ncbi:hypothetical protein MSAN_02008200 [Mycena sanguinolenta]|uniref:Uncharacterized protein n=1 Tax=Mycena sanguinolenta TaxID=230812 RepID=A0A8H6XKY3_9AGAR|nr:hypothetical protein MSAN_02008200 [Mycena sanguinolenta]
MNFTARMGSEEYDVDSATVLDAILPKLPSLYATSAHFAARIDLVPPDAFWCPRMHLNPSLVFTQGAVVISRTLYDSLQRCGSIITSTSSQSPRIACEQCIFVSPPTSDHLTSLAAQTVPVLTREPEGVGSGDPAAITGAHNGGGCDSCMQQPCVKTGYTIDASADVQMVRDGGAR